jgi:hypothetical protein
MYRRSRDFAGLRGTSRDFVGLRETSRVFAGLRGTSRDFARLRGNSISTRNINRKERSIIKIAPRNRRGERKGYDLLEERMISLVNPRFFFAGTALDSKSEKTSMSDFRKKESITECGGGARHFRKTIAASATTASREAAGTGASCF